MKPAMLRIWRPLGSLPEVTEVEMMGTSNPTPLMASMPRIKSEPACSGGMWLPGTTARSQPSKPRSRSTMPTASYSTLMRCCE